MKSIYFSFSIVVAALNFGCFSSGDGLSKTDEPVNNSPKDVLTPVQPALQPGVASNLEVPKKDDEVYLQQARIMSRMSEIENELKLQREKIRLLEQGLLTGIAPDELKKQRSEESTKKFVDRSQKSGMPEEVGLTKPNLDAVTINLKDVSIESSPVQDGDEQASVISAKLKSVENLYQASRFGLAITELAAISREYGENAGDGKVRLWLGKSYARLKELTTARLEFESYLKGWPSSPYVAEVRLELAKVYAGLGLKERARTELQRVMKDFAGQEPSEIASLEFSKMQGGL